MGKVLDHCWSHATGAPAATSALKRAFDVVVAAGLLTFILPMLAVIAVAVSLSSPGPILFRQLRTGLHGQPFLIFKFRTMRVHEDGPQVKQAEKGDSRITPLGALLRRSSLDELPQLINVVRGDMSLVGPRPHAVSHDAQFARTVPAYNERFAVRPGITGLAQVNGFRGEIKSNEDLNERLDRDLEYCRCWSLSLDIKILIGTVITVAFHRRAY